MRTYSCLVLTFALVGCGSNGSSSGAVSDGGAATDSATTSDGSGSSDSASGDGGGMTDGPLPEAGAGSGTVSGSADGTMFTTVATSLWLGAPDDPTTTVVYVFSKPVACSELQSMGWDTRITNGTQFLEMKMFGVTPATYAVTSSMTPAPGEASVNYTLSSTMGTPMESGAAMGTVTLTTRVATTHATGSFMLGFSGTNNVSGTYDAVFCPGGHEP